MNKQDVLELRLLSEILSEVITAVENENGFHMTVTRKILERIFKKIDEILVKDGYYDRTSA